MSKERWRHLKRTRRPRRRKQLIIGALMALCLVFAIWAATSFAGGGAANADGQYFQLKMGNDGSYDFVPANIAPPTSTPTPTPTATDTPTPTPTGTPTPTTPPTTGYPAAPATTSTVSGQSFNAYSMPAGKSGVLYSNCTFTSSSSQAAALTIQNGASNLVFSHCTFTCSAWNDVSLNVSNANVKNVLFIDCTFGAGGRMGIECTQRPASNSAIYQNVNLENCTFQPVHDEAISFDGGYAACHSGVYGCTINGSDNSSSAQWSGAIECNGPTYFTVQDTTIYACGGHALNIEGPPGVAGHDVFNHLNIDYSVLKESRPTDSVDSVMFEFQHVCGASLKNCRFNTGSSSNHLADGGFWSGEGNCNNDFTGSTITGVTNAPQPTSGVGYFRIDSSDTGNIWPTKV